MVGFLDAMMLRDVAGAPKPPPKSKSLCTDTWTCTGACGPLVQDCLSVSTVTSSCTGTVSSLTWSHGGIDHTYNCNAAPKTFKVNEACDGSNKYDLYIPYAAGETAVTTVISWVADIPYFCAPINWAD